MGIKSLSHHLKPREKVLRYGIKSLNDGELLALILRVGTKEENVKIVANKIIDKFNGFSGLKKANISELISLKGIGVTKAIEILALFEINYRQQQEHAITFINPFELYQYAINKIGTKKEETLLLIIVAKNKISQEKILFTGNQSTLLVNIHLLLGHILFSKNKEFYCFHNHPSQIILPSKADLAFTKKLIFYSQILGLKFKEMVIVSEKRFFLVIQNHFQKIL